MAYWTGNESRRREGPLGLKLVEKHNIWGHL